MMRAPGGNLGQALRVGVVGEHRSEALADVLGRAEGVNPLRWTAGSNFGIPVGKIDRVFLKSTCFVKEFVPFIHFSGKIRNQNVVALAKFRQTTGASRHWTSALCQTAIRPMNVRTE